MPRQLCIFSSLGIFFTTRKEWYCWEGKTKDVLHPQFFLFLSISLRKGAFLLGRKSVHFWVKVRSFSKDRPYLLREKSAPFLWRVRSSSFELLSHKYMRLVLMNNPTGLKSPPLCSPPLNSRLSSIIQFRSIFSCDKILYVEMSFWGSISWYEVLWCFLGLF